MIFTRGSAKLPTNTTFLGTHHRNGKCSSQVGEDDYHQLKHDQCLRVDFKSFPTKFIELLDSCRLSTAAADGDANPEARGGGVPNEGGRPAAGAALPQGGPGEPSFLARLETVAPGGASIFSVVETNPFKELTHLSLKFRAGNDAAIKTYLAARLRQVGFCFLCARIQVFFFGVFVLVSTCWRGCSLASHRNTPPRRLPPAVRLVYKICPRKQLKAEVSLTSSALEDTRASLDREAAERTRLDSEASALRLDRERDLRDLRAAHSAELTAAREDGVRRAEEAAAARSSEVCVCVCVVCVCVSGVIASLS